MGDFFTGDFLVARFFGAEVFASLVVGLDFRVVLRLAMAEIVAWRFVLRVSILNIPAVNWQTASDGAARHQGPASDRWLHDVVE